MLSHAYNDKNLLDAAEYREECPPATTLQLEDFGLLVNNSIFVDLTSSDANKWLDDWQLNPSNSAVALIRIDSITWSRLLREAVAVCFCDELVDIAIAYFGADVDLFFHTFQTDNCTCIQQIVPGIHFGE